MSDWALRKRVVDHDYLPKAPGGCVPRRTSRYDDGGGVWSGHDVVEEEVQVGLPLRSEVEAVLTGNGYTERKEADCEGKKVRTLGSHGDSLCEAKQMEVAKSPSFLRLRSLSPARRACFRPSRASRCLKTKADRLRLRFTIPALLYFQVAGIEPCLH